MRSHEDFPLPMHAYCVQWVHCLISPQHTVQKSTVSTDFEKRRWRCLSADCNSCTGCTTDSHAQYRILHSEKKSDTSAGWWVIVCDIKHIFLSRSQQNVHAAWECLVLSHYDAPFRTHVGKIVSDPDIGADILSIQRENFHRKNRTRIVYLQTSRNFVVATVLVCGTTVRVWKLFFN
jgi:hypothetical protein